MHYPHNAQAFNKSLTILAGAAKAIDRLTSSSMSQHGLTQFSMVSIINFIQFSSLLFLDFGSSSLWISELVIQIILQNCCKNPERFSDTKYNWETAPGLKLYLLTPPGIFVSLFTVYSTAWSIGILQKGCLWTSLHRKSTFTKIFIRIFLFQIVHRCKVNWQTLWKVYLIIGKNTKES